MKINCVNGGHCDIDGRSWRSCGACRFSKCVEVGLKPEAVLTTAQRKQRMEKRLMVKKQRIGVVADVFSPDEVSQIAQVYLKQNLQVVKALGGFFMKQPTVFAHVLRSAISGAPLPRQDKFIMDKLIQEERNLRFREMEEMTTLSESDRAALLAKNLPLIRETRESESMNGSDAKKMATNCVDLPARGFCCGSFACTLSKGVHPST